MSGRRRRDDGWDEAASDGQGGVRDPWSDSQSQPWAERGRAAGRVRGELPAAGGTASEGAGWSGDAGAPGGAGAGATGGAGAAGGGWPGSGDWPQVNGYQQANGQGGYSGGDQAGYGGQGYGGAGQGYGDASQGYGGTGQGYGGGGQGYGAGQGSGTGGYGTQATFTPGGQGAAGPGYTEPGYSGTGYSGSDYSGSDYSGTGYAGPGYSGASYPTAGHDAAGYDGQGDSGYGYGYGYANSNGNGGGGYGGYGSADRAGGGYRDDGYGQRAYDGYGNGAYGAGTNGGMSPSYQPAQGTGAGPTWHPNGQFQETSATARFERFESPQAPDLPFGEYAPVNGTGPANGAASGTPRPYGRLSIFTLLEDKAAEFDWLAEQASEGVRTSEPDTLVYVIHVVPKAPLQRIIYEIYRDRAAMESHERQPHIQRFVAARKACVLATNIIDLRLKYAKVASLSAPSAAPSAAPPGRDPQLSQPSQAMEPGTRGPSFTSANGDGRYPAQAANGGGWPAEDSTAQYAAPGQDYSRGPDGRVLRSRAQDWDQSSYQRQRYGGS